MPPFQKIKNRKFLSFCLFLVFTLFFIGYPGVVSAADTIIGTIWNASTWIPKNILKLIWSLGGKEAATDVIQGVMGMIFSIATIIFTIAAWIFEGIYNLEIIQTPITRGSGVVAGVVTHGWAIVRDFANMFIVLGFVIIGLATILRIREYEAQKKLLPLIIAALLINFSLLITGIVIDATNITMRYFTQISGPTTIIKTYKDILFDERSINEIEKIINEAGADEKITVAVSVYSAMSILVGTVAMIFFIYGVLFLFRYVALMCLVILSPLAFVCAVFPATRQIYEKWKSQFIQWAIIGIPTAFFVYLGTYLLTSFIEAGLMSPAPGTSFNPIGVSLSFWVPTAFMFFAYSLIFQTSAIGASAAIGLATGAVGYAMGASKWVGGKALTGARGMADKASGGRLSQGGPATKDAFLGFGEKIGVVKAGTVADRKQQRLKESTSAFEKQYGDNPEDNRKMAELLQKRMTSAKDKAAITTLLARREALGYIPKEAQEKEVANAISFGTSREIFTKERPDLVTGITDKGAREQLINEERARLELIYPVGVPDREKSIEKGLSKYAPTVATIENKKREMAKEKEQERKLGYIAPTDKDVAERARENYKPTAAQISGASLSPKELAAAKAELSRSRPSGAPLPTNDEATEYHLKKYYKPDTGDLLETKRKLTMERAKEKAYGFKYADRSQTQTHLIDKEAKRLRDAGFSGFSLDTEIKKYSDKLKPADIDAGLVGLNNEREQKAISKLTVSKLRDIHESQVDANLAEHSNYGTLDRASLEFTTELKNKYKTLLPELKGRLKSSLALPETANDKDIKAKIAALKASKTKTDKELLENARGITRKLKMINNW